MHLTESQVIVGLLTNSFSERCMAEKKQSRQSVPTQACWHPLLSQKAPPHGERECWKLALAAAPASAQESDLHARGGNKVVECRLFLMSVLSLW